MQDLLLKRVGDCVTVGTEVVGYEQAIKMMTTGAMVNAKAALSAPDRALAIVLPALRSLCDVLLRRCGSSRTRAQLAVQLLEVVQAAGAELLGTARSISGMYSLALAEHARLTSSKTTIIGGTKYNGQIKKEIFSVQNLRLPLAGILTMHAGASEGECVLLAVAGRATASRASAGSSAGWARRWRRCCCWCRQAI